MLPRTEMERFHPSFVIALMEGICWKLKNNPLLLQSLLSWQKHLMKILLVERSLDENSVFFQF